MRAKRWPYWPPALITTDGVHGDTFHLMAAPEATRGKCCVSLNGALDDGDEKENEENGESEKDEDANEDVAEAEAEDRVGQQVAKGRRQKKRAVRYCASPPATEDIFRRREWLGGTSRIG